MERLLLDVRYGVRTLLRSPGFTAVALIALMLGIGANTAIFSVVNAVLLRPLPFEQSDRLVSLSERAQVLEGMSIAYPNFLDWRTQNNSFEQLAVYRRQSYTLTGVGEPQQLTGGEVSAALFPVLRVATQVGRTFTDDEDKPDATRVVVLSDGVWRRHFGGDASVIDQPINLSGKSYTVIGVMPPDFQFPSRAEIWLPVGQQANTPGWQSRGNHPGLYGVARLKPGVTVEQSRADMDAVTGGLAQRYPDTNTGNSATITPLLEIVVRGIRPGLIMLLCAVGFVLLIACANVANLLLSRAATRQRELAIRAALGAGRLRLMRQMLTESVVLAVVGGGLGLLVANWGVKALVAVNAANIPRSREISLDVRVLLFTLGVSVVTGLVFGLIPALQASRPDMNETLKDAGRGSTGALRQRLRRALVVAEVALSLMLLIGAGLMIKSFYRLYNVDPGFTPENLLAFQVSLPESKYPDAPKRTTFFKQAVERISLLPGVNSVGAATGLPLGNNGNQHSFAVVGQPEPPRGERPLLEVAYVSNDYFKTMNIAVLAGRIFTDQDTREAPPVLVVDETFGERYWPGESVIGKQISTGPPNAPVFSTVVGVVRRVKMEQLDNDSGRVQGYYPYLTSNWVTMSFVVRTTSEPGTMTDGIRQEILALDKDQPIYNVRTVEKIRDDSVAPQRLNMLLLAIFSGVAMVLAAVGIYGVMAYSVAQRTHEIGIRIALGAGRGDVLSLVVRQGMTLAVVGIGIGLGGAFVLTRWMQTLLFDVGAADPATFALIAAIISGVALVACVVPARRAAGVDPVIALRYE